VAGFCLFDKTVRLEHEINDDLVCRARFADIDVSRVQLSGESRRKRALITVRRASPRAGCCGGRHGNDDGRTRRPLRGDIMTTEIDRTDPG